MVESQGCPITEVVEDEVIRLERTLRRKWTKKVEPPSPKG